MHRERLRHLGGQAVRRSNHRIVELRGSVVLTLDAERAPRVRAAGEVALDRLRDRDLGVVGRAGRLVEMHHPSEHLDSANFFREVLARSDLRARDPRLLRVRRGHACDQTRYLVAEALVQRVAEVLEVPRLPEESDAVARTRPGHPEALARVLRLGREAEHAPAAHREELREQLAEAQVRARQARRQLAEHDAVDRPRAHRQRIHRRHRHLWHRRERLLRPSLPSVGTPLTFLHARAPCLLPRDHVLGRRVGMRREDREPVMPLCDDRLERGAGSLAPAGELRHRHRRGEGAGVLEGTTTSYRRPASRASRRCPASPKARIELAGAGPRRASPPSGDPRPRPGTK